MRQSTMRPLFKNSCFLVCVFLLMGTVYYPGQAHAEVIVKKFALYDDRESGGSAFRSFNFNLSRPYDQHYSFGPSINQVGQVAFYANMFNVPGKNNHSGVWLTEGQGTFTEVVRERYFLPGVEHVTVNIDDVAPFSDFSLNNKGEMAFYSYLQPTYTGAPTTDRGIWGPDGNGGLRLVAAKGQVVSAMEGYTFDSLSRPFLDDQSRVYFSSKLRGPDGKLAGSKLFASLPTGELLTITDKGQYAPGTDQSLFSGTTFIRFNDAGQALLNAELQVGVGDTEMPPDGWEPRQSSNERGVWFMDQPTTQPQLIAREGDAAPHLGDARLTEITGVSLNDTGRMLLKGTLDTGRTIMTQEYVTTPENPIGEWIDVEQFIPDKALWVADTHGQFDLAVHTSMPAPGTEGGWFSQYIYSDNFDLNNHGQMVINAQYEYDDPQQGGGTGIWLREQSGEMIPIVLSRQQAPGTDGMVFAGSGSVGINDYGDVVFTAAVYDPNDESDFKETLSSLWFFDGMTHELNLVAIKGQEMLLENGQRTSVSAISLWTDSNWPERVLNDQRQVAFILEFKNFGSGVYVVQAIPEPTPAMLMTLTAGLLLTSRRRKIQATN